MANTTVTPAEVHKQYNEIISVLRRCIDPPQLRARFEQEIDGYIRECALGVWQADDASQVSPRHVEYYNALYTRGTRAPAALYWEVASGVANYAGFRPPAFYAQLRERDMRAGSNLSLRFADQLMLLMLLFASVDGVISEAEARFANRCAEILGELCARDGLQQEGKPPLRAEQFITRPAPQPGPAAPEAEAEAEKPNLDELLAELDGLCGLERVKQDVKSLINLVKVRKLRQAKHLPVPPMSLHLVFLGNPGTGKTTVARLLAKIYCALGVLSRGQLVEVDRSGLVAGFVGQTAIKTGEAVQKALGGVLFVDEAYALVNQDNANDFGHEAIEVLLKNMEDHREDFIVIVAGYTDLMERFIHANPGLESRFNKYFYFEDYDGAQLLEIFLSMCKRNGYHLSDGARERLGRELARRYEARDENFGNAREVRNLFERAVARQADRLSQVEDPDVEALMALLPEDLELEAAEE